MARKLVFTEGKTCPICGKFSYLRLDEAELETFARVCESGHGQQEPIQDIYPNMTPFERDFMKYGYCPHCQEKISGIEFKPDDEERFIFDYMPTELGRQAFKRVLKGESPLEVLTDDEFRFLSVKDKVVLLYALDADYLYIDEKGIVREL